jgi:hypothetical protein
MGRTVVGGERAGGLVTGEGREKLTSEAGLPAGAARGRGARLMGGAGVSGAGERCWVAWAAGGRGEGRAREGGLGQKRPSRGGVSFSFFFFSISISFFYFYFFFFSLISFSFEQIFIYVSWVSKLFYVMCY